VRSGLTRHRSRTLGAAAASVLSVLTLAGCGGSAARGTGYRVAGGKVHCYGLVGPASAVGLCRRLAQAVRSGRYEVHSLTRVPNVSRAMPARMMPRSNVHNTPFSGLVMTVHNAWVANTGATFVGVYAGVVPAGEAGAGQGVLMVFRQNQMSGAQSLRTIRVPGGRGGVWLHDAPLGVAGDRAALDGEIPFRTKGGRDGLVNLKTDRVTWQ
jgi:hypothetical protein